MQPGKLHSIDNFSCNMDNVRASTVKRKLFGVITEEDRLAFQQNLCRYIENTKINFERRRNFNLCEDEWDFIDQENVPFSYRNSIFNTEIPPSISERVTK